LKTRVAARSNIQIRDGLDLFAATAPGEFPAPTDADLRLLQAKGFLRLGIVAAFIDERQRFLVGRHRPSGKIPARPQGVLGPLAETSHWTGSGNSLQVETVAQTLSRCLLEEAGVQNPNDLELEVHAEKPWLVSSWPVGVRYPGQHAAAVYTIAHINSDRLDELVAGFLPHDGSEINTLVAMETDLLHSHVDVRPGTHQWLGEVLASGLADTAPSERIALTLPIPVIESGAQDVIFSEMGA